MKHGKDGWIELDPASDMTVEQRQAYEAYKEAYRYAKELRDQYEAAMQAALQAKAPAKAFVFGYNFGKASVKVVNASELRAKAAPRAQAKASLADWLEAQASDGRTN